MDYFKKMHTSARSPLTYRYKSVCFNGCGAFLTLFLLSLLTNLINLPWLMAPFGASCVLAFGAWNAPFSQPRNIIGGHFLAALVGLTVLQLIPHTPYQLALAVGLSLIVMQLTKTSHPPAGATPIVIICANASWSYLFFPVLAGSCLLVICALLFNNLSSTRHYPTFWL
ncbi:HPP family protein [Brochothrix campestris]|uniref:HPP family protein n=1 Tax=Brochothrix campestris FSL F6-1037 TaxID=1265861 RepID=W7CN89_9LIST|nr:HPP family protein [Brochothrix campestris]EUJ37116.1 HPP family protein [Brochothrix campestris FSL F6-1037]